MRLHRQLTDDLIKQRSRGLLDDFVGKARDLHENATTGSMLVACFFSIEAIQIERLLRRKEVKSKLTSR